MIQTGENRRNFSASCSSATWFTTKLTWPEPGSNPVLHSERPATDCVNHGTVFKIKINLLYTQRFRGNSWLPLESSQLMLYREIIAVCSQIHTKHINTLCGQNVELMNVKLAVHIVTTGLYRVKSLLYKPVR